MKSIHTRVLTLTRAGLLCAASASALAQSMPDTAPTVSVPASATGIPIFKTVDGNADGKISLEEFQALGGEDPIFTKLDTNQDKGLSQDEFAKLGKPNA